MTALLGVLATVVLWGFGAVVLGIWVVALFGIGDFVAGGHGASSEVDQ